MKILVVGGGGREHAIIRALKKSPDCGDIWCAPGNGGIGYDATCKNIPATDVDAMVAFAKAEAFDYVVVAQDDPLALGMVDALAKVGIPAFGPDAAAARIEASKVFSKDLMKKYGIPTAGYETFDDPAKVMDYIRSKGKYPVVIKADGLALGKGVLICQNEQEAADGVKEIMLIGQNVNSYGLDSDEGVSFAQLLHRVSQTGIERIRFMTSHPKDLSDALIDEMAHNPAIAPHLHLPVQAGSNRILQAMNRRYTREQYLEKVQKLRAAIPHIGLTTDLIVAFPGETEAEFEDTLSLVEQVRYDSAYTFIYSPRKGTRAAEMPGRIAPDVASERIERLIALQEKITGEVLASMRGETVQALVEGVSRRRENQLTGKTGRNINVNFNGAPDDIGKMVRVRITGAGSNTLRGEKVEE